MAMTEDLPARLREFIPAERVLEALEERITYARDGTQRAESLPDVVVRASSAEANFGSSIEGIPSLGKRVRISSSGPAITGLTPATTAKTSANDMIPAYRLIEKPLSMLAAAAPLQPLR